MCVATTQSLPHLKGIGHSIASPRSLCANDLTSPSRGTLVVDIFDWPEQIAEKDRAVSSVVTAVTTMKPTPSPRMRCTAGPQQRHTAVAAVDIEAQRQKANRNQPDMVCPTTNHAATSDQRHAGKHQYSLTRFVNALEYIRNRFRQYFFRVQKL